MTEPLIALTDGQSEVTAHFANPPFQKQELLLPRMRTVLDSFEVAGPHSAALAYATTRFHEVNLRTAEAFLVALDHANTFIRTEPRQAAELSVTSERFSAPVAMIEALLRDPQTRCQAQPEGLDAFIAFQHRAGVLKQKPETWREVMSPGVLARAP